MKRQKHLLTDNYDGTDVKKKKPKKTNKQREMMMGTGMPDPTKERVVSVAHNGMSTLIVVTNKGNMWRCYKGLWERISTPFERKEK